MQNTTIPILENICANCVAVTNGEETYLFSYSSPILKIKNDEITQVYPHYDYSMTTTKHINKFIWKTPEKTRYFNAEMNRV